MFIPICKVNHHWALLEITKKQANKYEISLLDSLSGCTNWDVEINAVARMLRGMIAIQNRNCNMISFEKKPVTVKQQQNLIDCGFHVCENLISIVSNIEIIKRTSKDLREFVISELKEFIITKGQTYKIMENETTIEDEMKTIISKPKEMKEKKIEISDSNLTVKRKLLGNDENVKKRKKILNVKNLLLFTNEFGGQNENIVY